MGFLRRWVSRRESCWVIFIGDQPPYRSGDRVIVGATEFAVTRVRRAERVEEGQWRWEIGLKGSGREPAAETSRLAALRASARLSRN